MSIKTTRRTPKGFSLIEIVISVALFMIIASGLAVLAIGGPLNSLENQKRTQADAFLTESWEAVKSIRNQDWALITNGTHGLSSLSSKWLFSGSSDSYAGITRQITVEDVQRDDSGNIVVSGGTVDLDTKKITIDLSWSPTANSSQNLSVQSYLTHYTAPSELTWPIPPPPAP